MKKIIVTGGTGKAGRAVIQELTEHGYQVRNLDRVGKRISGSDAFLFTELSDYGQTIDAMSGYEAVIHLAAIPAPDIYPEEMTFRNNITSTFNTLIARQRDW